MEGDWNVVSGSWSFTEEPGGFGITRSVRTCTTSSGVIMFVPTSGFEAGDRCAAMAEFLTSTATNGVYGLIFDAIDENNCHRIRVTKAGTSRTLALEEVSGGSVNVLEQVSYDFVDKDSTIVSERGPYLYESVEPLFLPRDGSYTKKNGTQFGLFVDSHDGTSIGFRSLLNYYFGQNTCDQNNWFTPCAGSDGDWMPKQGLSSTQASVSVQVNSFEPSAYNWASTCDPEATYNQAWWFPPSVVCDYEGLEDIWGAIRDASGPLDYGTMQGCRFGYQSETCCPEQPDGNQSPYCKHFTYRVGLCNAREYVNDIYPALDDYHDLDQKFWRVRVERITSWELGPPAGGRYTVDVWKSAPLLLTDMEPGKSAPCGYEGKYNAYWNYAPSTFNPPYTADLGPATVTFL